MVFLSRFVGAAANPHLAAYGGNYLGFMVLGLLAAEFQQVGVSGLAQRIRMAQMMGTLEAELATPAPPWMVLGAAPVYEFGAAALRSTAYLVGASLLLGPEPRPRELADLVLGVPLVVAAFSGLGLLAAGTTMLVRRLNPVAMVIGLAVVLSLGRDVPGDRAARLAAGHRQGCCPSPTPWRCCAARCWSGPAPAALADSFLALAIFAAVLAPLGAAAFRFALRRTRDRWILLSHY